MPYLCHFDLLRKFPFFQYILYFLNYMATFHKIVNRSKSREVIITLCISSFHANSSFKYRLLHSVLTHRCLCTPCCSLMLTDYHAVFHCIQSISEDYYISLRLWEWLSNHVFLNNIWKSSYIGVSGNEWADLPDRRGVLLKSLSLVISCFGILKHLFLY